MLSGKEICTVLEKEIAGIHGGTITQNPGTPHNTDDNNIKISLENKIMYTQCTLTCQRHV
jgi:hypothetical protein